MTPCQDFVPKSDKDCIQDIEYHFLWENKSKFTVDPSRNLKNYKTFAKVDGKYLNGEDWWFHPLGPWGENVHFVHIESSFDVCKSGGVIPSAQIKISADVIPQDQSEQKLLDGNYIQPCVDEFFHPVITLPASSAPTPSPSTPVVLPPRNEDVKEDYSRSSNSKGGKGRMTRKSRTVV